MTPKINPGHRRQPGGPGHASTGDYRPRRGYPAVMASGQGTDTDTTAMLAAVGIPVDEAGKARARERLRAARARWTPQLDAEARRQLGLPARAA